MFSIVTIFLENGTSYDLKIFTSWFKEKELLADKILIKLFLKIKDLISMFHFTIQSSPQNKTDKRITHW